MAKDGSGDGVQNKSDDSSVTSVSDSAKLIAPRSHRPKSIITEFSNDMAEDKVNFDSPPMPSALKHVSKYRPRPMRNYNKRTKPQAVLVEVQRSHSGSENGDNSVVYDTAANELSPCSPGESEADGNSSNRSVTDEQHSRSPVVARRSAMLPPQENTVQPSAPPLPTTAPPIVPRRGRDGAPIIPPTLPPKPDQIVTARPVSCTVDGENGSSGRKSVADMARLFSSTDAPFSRRS
ncbi:unnamed protein product [Gongylonema pulchrum]|uniref:Uncharacterized protein n=1 Tax=Gongylonema pulchrum TaxID=637853 RepID=A0A183EF04_9BILA|nr:unnamed protein product [Gongylonema pulchrum]